MKSCDKSLKELEMSGFWSQGSIAFKAIIRLHKTPTGKESLSPYAAGASRTNVT